MMSEKLRNALGAFAMTVMVGGPVIGLIALVAVISVDPSGKPIGEAIGKVIKLIVVSVLASGILRVLLSIDARLERRS